jgi:hypothetical protein
MSTKRPFSSVHQEWRADPGETAEGKIDIRHTTEGFRAEERSFSVTHYNVEI